jgi:formylglycine-generating enzyme required for sulfatase activity
MKRWRNTWIVMGMAVGLVVAALAVGVGVYSRPPKQMVLDLGNSATLKLVRIPAGTFLMGSPETERGRQFDERQHEVTISKPFYMGVTAVTVDQFAAFVAETGYRTDAEREGWSFGFGIEDGQLIGKGIDGCSWRKPSFEQRGDHPVVHVTWNDARAFCDWLSKKSGRTVTLPTEAQWEYACRGGTTTAYPWGANAEDGLGWSNGADQSLKRKLPGSRWPFFSFDDGFAYTSPAGALRANGFGLCDMNGNVCQWCLDFYGAYPTEAAVDPTGPVSGTLRVQRGGSWFNAADNCRSAFRRKCDPGKRYDDNSFRVVVTGAE